MEYHISLQSNNGTVRFLGDRVTLEAQKTRRTTVRLAFVVSGGYLSFRAVSSQVLSAYKGLTSVFGMGTGGSP